MNTACDVYALGKLLYWMFAGRVMSRENFDEDQWDLRKQLPDEPILNFVYELFQKTICQLPSSRLENANLLKGEVDKMIDIAEREGRFLDANVPSNCLFCGVGKYSKKDIIPRMLRMLPRGPNIEEPQQYELNYNHQFGIGSGSPVTLPQGNISQGLYPHFLLLTCDHCSNMQFFGFENTNNAWKNATPPIM